MRICAAEIGVPRNDDIELKMRKMSKDRSKDLVVDTRLLLRRLSRVMFLRNRADSLVGAQTCRVVCGHRMPSSRRGMNSHY